MQDLHAPEWDLDSEYPGLLSPGLEAERQDLVQRIEKLETMAQQLEGENTLQQAQNMAVEQKEAEIILFNLLSYVHLKRSTDLKNGDARRLLEQFKKLGLKLQQALQPLEQFYLRADHDTFEAFIAAPELSDSQFYYRNHRKQSAHLLPLEQENLISGLGMDGFQAWGNLYTNLTGSIDYELLNEDDEKETVGVARLLALLGDKNATLRQRAYQGLQDVFTTHQESCAAILNALSGWRLEMCERRSHQKEQHFLDAPLHSNRLERQSLDSMIEAVKGRRAMGHKALSLMAKALGKEAIDPWDEMAPAPDFSGKTHVMDFEEAMDIIVKAFSEVDPSMGEFARMMQEKRWIDAAAQAHKTPGAFCSGFAKSRTPRVLMTYLGSTSNLITLAHELGHAFHSWVMREMPYRETRYPMSLAETASTFAETVVRHYLVRHAESPAQRLEILWQEVASIPRFGINLPVRYEFERQFYEQRAQGAFTPDDLRQLMASTWTEWYGESMNGANELFWASKLHFYITGISFYNFPYTFGYLFSQRIYAEHDRRGADFFDFYTALLRDTGRMSVEDLVQKHFDTDARQPEFWNASFEIMAQYLQQFESLLNEVMSQ